MAEKWKTIDECPGYEVSDKGHVRNKNTGRILRPAEVKRPRCQSTSLRVVLMDNGGRNSRYVHRLVAAAFVPNPENLPMVEHINGDFHDNRAANLRWSDRESIMQSEIINRRINKNNPRRKK